MRPIIASAAFVLLHSLASGQSTPNAAEILKKVSETYNAASRYEIESSVIAETPGTPGQRTYSMHIWFAAPDKYRVQSSGEFCADQGADCPPGVHELLIVYRGGTLWNYDLGSKEYREYTAPDLPRDSRPEDVDLYGGAGIFRHASEAFAGGRFLREERVTTEGRSVNCAVIEVAMPGGDGAATLWIDQAGYHVLRMESRSASAHLGVDVSYKTVNLNEPIADDLFEFKPPPEARKIDPGQPFGKPNN